MKETQQTDTELTLEHVQPLGEQIMDFAQYLSVLHNTPLDYVFSPILAALSTAIGSKAQVLTGPHVNHLNLFLVSVGRPGANKSAPAKLVLKPLVDYNATLYHNYKRELAAYMSAGPKEKGPKPVKRAISLSDVTIERLALALGDNPAGLLLYRDEVGAYLQALSRYSSGGGGEVRSLCEIYDGSQLVIDRKGEDLYLVDSPYLSLFGTTQPNSLRDVFGRPELADSGFLQRFCFFYPEKQPAFRKLEREQQLSQVACDKWDELLRSLIGFPGQIRLTFDQEAWYFYNSFLSMSFRKQQECGDYEAQAWSKLNITTSKLAGICAVARRAPLRGDESDFVINRDDMTFSFRIAKLLHRNQTRIWHELCGPGISSREAVQALGASHKIANVKEFARNLDLPYTSVVRWVNQGRERAGR